MVLKHSQVVLQGPSSPHIGVGATLCIGVQNTVIEKSPSALGVENSNALTMTMILCFLKWLVGLV